MTIAANTAALDAVLKHPGIWRRSATSQPHVRALSTGLRELDALLPGGGWPCGALTEILFEYDGLGELSLLMPALAGLTQRRQRVVFVAPPYIPYAPALAAYGLDLNYVVQLETTTAEGAWSAEQCLRSGSCGAVLGWLHEGDYTQLRRLQLAAESGDALAFLFRPAHATGKSSPAALRLQLHVDADEAFKSASGQQPIRARRDLQNLQQPNGHSGSFDFAPSEFAQDPLRTPSERIGTARVDIEILKCRGILDPRSSTRLRWRA